MVCVNVSPDFVVPITESSINQNILAFTLSEIALNETLAVSVLSVITIRVVSAGLVIIIPFSESLLVFKLHPGVYGGGVLRRMPAR